MISALVDSRMKMSLPGEIQITAAFSRALEDNEMKLTVRVMNTLGMKSRSGKYTIYTSLM